MQNPRSASHWSKTVLYWPLIGRKLFKLALIITCVSFGDLFRNYAVYKSKLKKELDTALATGKEEVSRFGKDGKKSYFVKKNSL